MSEELKPCPFCGGRAIFEQAKSQPCQLHGERETLWRIVCRHQQTNFMPDTNANLPECHICPTITASTKERAAELWNNRAALAGGVEIGRDEMAKIVHGTSFGVISETEAGAVYDALSLNNMKIIEVKP